MTILLKNKHTLKIDDFLFKCSIGRTDLPFGDSKILIESIKKKIITLPEETKIYCGHGPDTLLSFEKENNPYLQFTI